MKSLSKLPDTTSETELLGLIDQLNADPDVHGILVQLPCRIRLIPTPSSTPST